MNRIRNHKIETETGGAAAGAPRECSAPARRERPCAMETSLTFFLSMDERRRALTALRRFGSDRRGSLLKALRLDAEEASDHG